MNLGKNLIILSHRRTDAEVPILWPPDGNSQLIGRDSDAGKDWRQKEKTAADKEMFG